MTTANREEGVGGPRRSRHILVVDDDPSIRFLVERLLTDEGFSLTMAATGAEALDAAKSDVLDAALLDVHGQDAVAVVTTLRSHHPALPIFLFTALNRRDAEATLETMPEGVGLILKPFDPDELVETLEAALDGRMPEP